MAYYRCGPTAIGNRASWSVTSPTVEPKSFDRPLSGNYDRIFNAFERTNAFEYVRSTFEGKTEERHVGHGDIVVNRKMSSSYERADCALAAQTPCSEDEDFYREKILYSQARQLFPLQEDLADWINKITGISYVTGENFLDTLDNGAELCQLAAVIHERAREALEQGLVVGPVPSIKGRCWQRAARRSFFARDNADNFITFCRDLGVHENLLFESDDLVLHNQPRQVILCLLEVARLATRFAVEPPGLVCLEQEIAREERDSGLDSAMSGAPWQFRDTSPAAPDRSGSEHLQLSSDANENLADHDNADAESTRSGGTEGSSDTDVPLKPTNELDKRVQLVTRLLERGCRCGEGGCSRLLKVKKVGEGRYNIAGRNVFIRLLKGRHMMVRVGGGWDTLEHFLSRHEPCQVRLVAPGRRDLLPVPPAGAPGPPARPSATPSPASSRASLARDSRDPSTTPPDTSGKSSPVDHKLSSGKTSPFQDKFSRKSSIDSKCGKISPVDCKTGKSGKSSPVDLKVKSGKSSPIAQTLASGKTSPVEFKTGTKSGKISPLDVRRSSTPTKPRNKTSMTLPLDSPHKPALRTRKQSAPASFSTPSTPTGRSSKTPPVELRKSLTTNNLNTPKKARSMSVVQNDKKPFCGTDRLNQSKTNKSSGFAMVKPAEPSAKPVRSHSLASTPTLEPRRSFSSTLAKKTRSMSLASPADIARPLHKSASAAGGLTQAATGLKQPVGGLTQAAIEESIRRSLEANVEDQASHKKPFLHIKAKYRSAPPREVPPR